MSMCCARQCVGTIHIAQARLAVSASASRTSSPRLTCPPAWARHYSPIIDPQTGLLRAGTVDSPDRLESEPLAFHERVRTGFLTLAAADRDRYVIVDATLPVESVAARVLASVVPVVGAVAR